MEPNTKITTANLEEIFADRRDVKFWKKEGPKHSYLFWVRAMTSKEPVQIERKSHDPVDISIKERREVYDLLARSFDAPTPGLVKTLADGSFSQILECINTPKVQKGEKLILNMKGLDDEELLDILEKEYTAIFFDTYMPFIPPYESIYRGEKHVMGKYARDAEAFYRKIGLGADLEMPDHISHECEFVSILCEKESDSEENEKYRTMREEFLCNHLLVWGSAFCSDLAALAKSDFYKGVSLIGEEFFDLEYNVIYNG